MIALREVKQQMQIDPNNWALFLMDFVDDFRYYKDPQAIAEPLPYTDPRLDPLLASTAESLCDFRIGWFIVKQPGSTESHG